jgi:tRNA pseudouridine38-40 synthase
MSLRNLKAVIEYDGTRYLGWQIQARGPTIQAEIESGLAALTGQKIRVVGSGRTDAGVHALGQVANFRVESRIPTERFAAALNAKLPRDISVVSIEEADPDFHARFDARAKHYRYAIVNRRSRPALERHRVYHFSRPLDADAMRRAATALVGRHDFKSFATVDPVRAGRSTEREMYQVGIARDGERIRMDFVASGFLYNMVRCLAGTLVQVGIRKWEPAHVKDILASRDRTVAGPNLPACGLTLVRVHYEDDAFGSSGVR